tara:strand:- start:95513 stop:96403 length:891 start_codon:yes stop_codon:yes gene_type:complete
MSSRGKTAICIGNFDGLHKGHRKLLDEFQKRARSENLKPILITFRPHPFLFFNPQKRYLLSDYSKKIELIRSVYPSIEINITEFDKKLQSMSAKEYCEQILMDKEPALVCVGYDLQIGHDKKYARDIIPSEIPDCEVLEISPVKDGDKIISSSLIRECLASGEVSDVREYLMRDFSMIGIVGTGKKLGRTIGFPTLNIEIHKNIVSPRFGVYGVEIVLNDEKFYGIMNIGKNPTVSDDEQIKVEVHVLDFNRDVYGEEVEVRFKSFVRDEKKFDSLDLLKQQILKDVNTVKEYFEI